MGVLNLCMKKNPFSRTFHFILLVPCIVLLVMASSSLGTFVPLHLEIKDYDNAGAGSGDAEIRTCILFATTDSTETEVIYREDNSCDFMIWGQVAVGSLSVAMGAVLIVKAFIGTKIFSVFALIELLLTVAGFIFTLALGVVITVGTDDTCLAFNKANTNNRDTKFMPCEEFEYAGDSEIKFYDRLNVSRIVTWIEAGVLFLLLIWFVLVNLLNCATTCCRPPKNKPTKL